MIGWFRLEEGLIAVEGWEGKGPWWVRGWVNGWEWVYASVCGFICIAQDSGVERQHISDGFRYIESTCMCWYHLTDLFMDFAFPTHFGFRVCQVEGQALASPARFRMCLSDRAFIDYPIVWYM